MNLLDIIPFLLIAAVMYFLIFKPQIDERRAHEALVASLARGDRVVTGSGIHGKVMDVAESTVIIDIGDRTKVTFDKNAIVRRDSAPDAQTTKG